MISNLLVRPSYTSIKLMDVLNFIPLSLDLKTGKLTYHGHWTARFIHNTVFCISALKVLQIFYALIRLLVNFDVDSLHVVILTALCLSLFGTSTYWASELFHGGLAETIMLFNSLKYGPSDRLTDQVCDWRSIKDWKSASSWAKAAARLGLSLNLQELLCIATPFGVKIVAPLYIVMMMVYPHWMIFATSFIYNWEGAWWKLGFVMLILLEIVSALYTESNILFVFFFQLALQVNHLVCLENTNDDMRLVDLLYYLTRTPDMQGRF